MAKAGGVILAAGRGERMGAAINKAYLPLGDRPLLLYSVLTFEETSAVAAYVVVVQPAEVGFCRALLASYDLQKLAGVEAGGDVRQESAAAGVRALPEDCSLVAVHDAARPLLSVDMLEDALEAARSVEALVVAVPARETIKLVDETGLVTGTPARDRLWIAQTPQIFRRELLLRAYAAAGQDGFQGTDDASLVERLGISVAVCQGSYENIKVTTPEDLRMAAAILQQRRSSEKPGRAHPFHEITAAAGAEASTAAPSGFPLGGRPAGVPALRAGIGYDVHAFDPGCSLMLGGVYIPEGPGLAGHSDADAALHALMDACLGAAGRQDIGHLFPPGDRRWKDAPSLALLAAVRSSLAVAGYAVCQVDLMIAAEAPRLAPYIETMRQRIAAVLGIPPGCVGIKATTCEGLGFVGRREGIAAWAIATIAGRPDESRI